MKIYKQFVLNLTYDRDMKSLQNQHSKYNRHCLNYVNLKKKKTLFKAMFQNSREIPDMFL